MRKSLIAATASLVTAGAAQGAVLVEYDFGPQDQVATLEATSVAAGITNAEAISAGAGVGAFSFQTVGEAGTGDQDANLPVDAPAAPAGAVARVNGFGGGNGSPIPSDDYLAFGFDVAPNTTATLSELFFDLTRTASTGFEDVQPQYSVNGGAFTSLDTALESPPDVTFDRYSFALDQALSAGDSVEFRIFLGTGNDARNLSLDNVAVIGTTVVPEPGSLGVAALGLTAFALRRRRNA